MTLLIKFNHLISVFICSSKPHQLLPLKTSLTTLDSLFLSMYPYFQAKTIAKKFLGAYGSQLPQMTVTDMTSLGDFVIHIIDELRDGLPMETIREAVRIMGTSSHSRRLPKAARQRKVQIILAILVKEYVCL